MHVVVCVQAADIELQRTDLKLDSEVEKYLHTVVIQSSDDAAFVSASDLADNDWGEFGENRANNKSKVMGG